MAIVLKHIDTDDNKDVLRYMYKNDGDIIDVAHVSSFIDTLGRARYVRSCQHYKAAPKIAVADGITEYVPCVCDRTSDIYSWNGCTCVANDNLQDPDTMLQKRGYIHVSIVARGNSHSINLYSEKAPNAVQMDTLFDMYMAAPEDARKCMAEAIDKFLTDLNREPMFNVEGK